MNVPRKTEDVAGRPRDLRYILKLLPWDISGTEVCLLGMWKQRQMHLKSFKKGL